MELAIKRVGKSNEGIQGNVCLGAFHMADEDLMQVRKFGKMLLREALRLAKPPNPGGKYLPNFGVAFPHGVKLWARPEKLYKVCFINQV